MKVIRKSLMIVAVLLVACSAWAEPINYVNTKLPGIHQAKNPKTGEMCWYDNMGNNLCTVENSLPMTEIDKFYLFMGDKENSWVKKEWDKERDCYVWKSIDGDFLGTDPESLSKKDLEWLAKVDPEWFEENGLPDEINNKLWEMKFDQIAKEVEKEMEEANKVWDIPDEDSPVFGNTKDPKLTIVEFTEFQCPYCSRIAPVMQELNKKYPYGLFRPSPGSH